MYSQKRIKIEQIEPNSNDFQLYFEIVEATKDGEKINCRIVDDTGIVNAYFDRFGSKLKVGGVFLMTHLKSCVIDSHIRVQMSEKTQASKQPDIIGFKDKSNDISKRVYDLSSTKKQDSKITQIKQPTPYIKQKEKQKSEQCIIPFTKQEALEQLKAQKQFFGKMKSKHTFKSRQKQFFATKGQKQVDKAKYEQKGQKQRRGIYEQKQDKNIKNSKISKQKNQLKKVDSIPHKTDYKPKPKEEQKKAKFEQRDNRITKAKSMMYRQKIQHKEQKKERLYKQKNEQKNGKHQHNQKKENPQNEKYQTAGKQSHKQTQIAKQKSEEGQRKQSQLIDIIKVLDQVGKHVHLRAWVTEKVKKVVDRSEESDHQIADSTGSVWLRITKFNLESKQAYQFQNLEVCKQEDKVFLKQSDLSQANRLEDTLSFNLRDINGKQ